MFKHLGIRVQKEWEPFINLYAFDLILVLPCKKLLIIEIDGSIHFYNFMVEKTEDGGPVLGTTALKRSLTNDFINNCKVEGYTFEVLRFEYFRFINEKQNLIRLVEFELSKHLT